MRSGGSGVGRVAGSFFRGFCGFREVVLGDEDFRGRFTWRTMGFYLRFKGSFGDYGLDKAEEGSWGGWTGVILRAVIF